MQISQYFSQALILSDCVFSSKLSLAEEQVPADFSITGCDFLKEDGFLKVLKVLSEKPNKKVVIKGNSYEVFACCALLLNGPLFYDKHEGPHNAFIEKRSKKCLRCCEICKKKQEDPPVFEEKPQIFKKNYTEFNNKKKKAAKESENKEKCECFCVCFGDFRPASFRNWKKSELILPIFKENDVVLLIDEREIKEKHRDLSAQTLRIVKEVIFMRFFEDF